MGDFRGVMMQGFHWYIPNDGSHWKFMTDQANALKQAGFSSIWLPPAYKGSAGANDTGYGVYDMYDLGEFDQKDTVRTKYGTKEEYLEAIQALHDQDLRVYVDIVLNHRLGGDESETFSAVAFSKEDRLTALGPAQEIESYTKFTFPGRKGAYSDFIWGKDHFDAVDFNAKDPEQTGILYQIEGKHPDDYVDLEHGNYDYLMGCDLDHDNEEVRQEILRWGEWYIRTTGADGFRLDAIKHIPTWAYNTWLDAMRQVFNQPFFTVGEYWSFKLPVLLKYLELVENRMSLFDVPLLYRFHLASKAGNSFDMSTILEDTLVSSCPEHAVTLVSNHDSQPLQSLDTPLEDWFKPLAYALILLRQEGYPCVFFGDYYGTRYTDKGNDGKDYDIVLTSFQSIINQMIVLRKQFTYGLQQDYFDHENTIGWTFTGDDEHPGSMAVILTNGSAGQKKMHTGKANTTYVDITGHIPEKITTDDSGEGEFTCPDGSLSLWIEEDYEG